MAVGSLEPVIGAFLSVKGNGAAGKGNIGRTISLYHIARCFWKSENAN